ncbi:MAG: hypothetical protein CVU11_16465 [Bacteroidetes bacterium HGW-Bacteroidetes-6]|jgi:hypothetical protein|nr:MAG: hypothetical protein CVU11_16465 [Bacteroidetes bacterium HGW-Bacteroidetes-6]
MEIIIPLLHTALTLTGIVLVMMLLIEYFNVQTQGRWLRSIQKRPAGQIFFGTLMGLLPGCFGTFFVVSLFTHGNIGFGALIATLIATSGDESFLMFSMIPGKALIIHGILAVVALGAGFLVHFLFRKKNFSPTNRHFEIHEDDHCAETCNSGILYNLKNISFQRAAIIFGLSLIIINLVAGESHGGDEQAEGLSHFHFEAILNYIFAGLSALTLFLILRVPDHFLSDHLWGHVIKKHFLRVFLWTFGALILIELALPELNAENWIKENPLYLLLFASLLGLIPESGPHMVFVTLFAGGYIPMSILVASSIVQDGHGALPLLAESQRSFIFAKLINLAVGLLIGYALLLAGL